ncbi:helix-turn-helix domain-containing protein [Streptomyces rubiginosohelvolus]|uniref:helix-turn-helix domain-containing protein n=1 Tax=Streptomyces rubiginosohelvolus TaxID=67362 RepID=UPI00368299B7
MFPEGWNALEQRQGRTSVSGDAEGAARAVLAERLSALREGSGRTYASLARRIGVSGSTLHRYCTGRTVPAEFAPVERLARLCGAPAEEREALHRLWLLADGERLDRQQVAEEKEGSAAEQGAEAEEGAEAEQGAEAEEGAEAEQGAEAEEGAEAEQGAEAEVAGAPSEGAVAMPRAPGALSGRSGPPDGEPPHAVPLPGTAPEATPVPALTPASGPGPAQSGSAEHRASRMPVIRSLRARRYGQGLGVLAAAVLVLALVAAFGRPWSSGPDGRSSVAQVPGGPPADSLGSPTSGSPKPEKPQGTATGSPRKTPSGSPSPTTSPGIGPRKEGLPRSSGPSSGPVAGRVPFTWTGDDHVWKNGCDHAYLLDRAPAAVPPPPVEADAASWAGALGAVHAGETGVRITLQGRDDRAVVLESLRIRVVERRSPAEGRVYRMSSGCGGSLTPRMFDVDLDADRPVARSVAGNDSGEPIEAVAFPYRVSVTDPEVFLITGRTVGCDCSWVAELAWSSGGRSGTVRIDDGGRPFRTNGVRGHSVLDYDTTAGRWVPAVDGSEAAS